MKKLTLGVSWSHVWNTPQSRYMTSSPTFYCDVHGALLWNSPQGCSSNEHTIYGLIAIWLKRFCFFDLVVRHGASQGSLRLGFLLQSRDRAPNAPRNRDWSITTNQYQGLRLPLADFLSCSLPYRR